MRASYAFRHDRACAGFTLVELLVALVLLALISTMLVGTLRFAHTAWAKGDAATERVQRTDMAMALLRRELEQAFPLSVPGVDQPRAITFAGNETSVLFLAPPAAALAMGGLQLTSLTIERQGDGSRLMLRWRSYNRGGEPWPPDLNDGRGMTELVLGDAPSGAAFSYFGPDPAPNSAPQWHRAWEDAVALPSLVRLSFGGGEAIPELLVAPREGGAAGIVSPLTAATN